MVRNQMNREIFVKLKQQLDVALNSNTSESLPELASALTEALRHLLPSTPVPPDALTPSLQALEDVWRKGQTPATPLPGTPEQQARLSRLLDDMAAVQNFTLSLAKGDLSQTLKASGAMAGGLKSLQASLRHVTWQTQKIAQGDFSQRIDFMGDFSRSFNTMTGNLAAARDDLQRRGEELAQANANLKAEIIERQLAEKLIQNLNGQLKQKIADLEEANQDLEAFSYSVSHDLRAPLRAIAGFAKMLEQDHGHLFDAESLRLLTVINDNARFMGKLIHDILGFTRLGRQQINKTTIDMTALTRAVIAELNDWGSQPAVKFTAAELPPAHGDQTMIRQVLVNLLTNAVKFTAPKASATIAMTGWRNGHETIYSVTDNGVGFDMRYADKLFSVFQRLHTNAEFEGTGVGLAIVHKIIQRHGGRVWAESQLNQGATFYFSLPGA
jgi:signal transduction histidine kinase